MLNVKECVHSSTLFSSPTSNVMKFIWVSRKLYRQTENEIIPFMLKVTTTLNRNDVYMKNEYKG